MRLTTDGPIPPDEPCGMLLLDKPQGLTSHDAVLVARRALRIRRIGHTGTLDPMAQGVLVLLVGSATKLQASLQTHRKVYETVIQLGQATDTGDAWGAPGETADVPALQPAAVADVLASFVGLIEQLPPLYSAVKVRGRPLYWWARRGRWPEIKPRTVEILAAELLSIDGSSIRCRVSCSSGTYIRTLAEAIAQRLGTVGHLRELVRVSVGPWTRAEARDLAWLREAAVDEVRAALRPVSEIAGQVACGASPSPV